MKHLVYYEFAIKSANLLTNVNRTANNWQTLNLIYKIRWVLNCFRSNWLMMIPCSPHGIAWACYNPSLHVWFFTSMKFPLSSLLGWWICNFFADWMWFSAHYLPLVWVGFSSLFRCLKPLTGGITNGCSTRFNVGRRLVVLFVFDVKENWVLTLE